MSELSLFDVLCGFTVVLLIAAGIRWYRQNYSAQAFLKRGIEYLQQDKYGLANEQFDQAINRDPRLIEAYFQRGMLFQSGLAFDRALADYNQVLHLDPGHIEAYRKRAKLFISQEKIDAALADWKQLLTLKPDQLDVYCERINFYAAQNRVEEAIQDCDQIITINPNFTDAYGKRAILYLRQDNLKSALASFDQLLNLIAYDAIAYNERGLIRETLGDLVGAIGDYDRAVTLKPRFADAFLNRGITHAKHYNMVNARADIDHAQTLYATSNKKLPIPTMSTIAEYEQWSTDFDVNGISIAWAVFSRISERIGETVYEIDKKDVIGALSDLDYAIELDPKLPMPYLFRGGIHQERREYFAALRDLLDFVRLGGISDFYEAAKREASGEELPDETEFSKIFWKIIDEVKSKIASHEKT